MLTAAHNTLNQKIANLHIKAVRGKFGLTHLHYVRINDSVALEQKQWCETQFKNDWIWSSPIHEDYSEFYFKHGEDALAFKLKFCCTPLDTAR